jgi:hypothetical protein
LIVELMFAFTLLALRCVNTFYSKRVKDVETFRCGRASLRKTFHRPRRRNTDCVYPTTKGDTRVRREFDLVTAAQKHLRGWKADGLFGTGTRDSQKQY